MQGKTGGDGVDVKRWACRVHTGYTLRRRTEHAPGRLSVSFGATAMWCLLCQVSTVLHYGATFRPPRTNGSIAGLSCGRARLSMMNSRKLRTGREAVS